MPDMTGEFKRKLDLADKASIDLIALNNKVSIAGDFHIHRGQRLTPCAQYQIKIACIRIL